MYPNTQDDWLKSPLGNYLLASEKAIYDQHVADIFGFNALQIGLLEMDLLQQSRIAKRLRADAGAGDVLCESEFLPFASASIDLLCLPHVLEFSQNPHQTLREVERVLVPEGHLILTGYNPMSAWGVRRLFSKKQHYPWCGNTLSLKRIKDWLALLGLEFVHGGTQAFILPINDTKWIHRQRCIETFATKCNAPLGGIYYIVAKKRVVNMTLLKPNWKKSLVKSALVATQQKTKPSQKINKKTQ
ncbi:methylase involved in ubiquinone/menaquinone biosynthesis [Methylophilaceae bacterium 11]|jgi:SAM-dependent methyltransferase|uniref:class I SAM-dependent methyltransferase n=1 Tax=unclassified Methylotenera TaxID=2643294 RepID=UPI00035DBC33|nr:MULTISPECIES: class I SAM-dependent methyltransferase [unclassified Methylotenera]EUJ10531.1 methylase involved in ubiquinone/menaquinone biosynthesis [Methylophilaceae bacterium 11]